LWVVRENKSPAPLSGQGVQHLIAFVDVSNYPDDVEVPSFQRARRTVRRDHRPLKLKKGLNHSPSKTRRMISPRNFPAAGCQ
jgi:hypothetical protein